MTFDNWLHHSTDEWDAPARLPRRKRQAYFEGESELLHIDLDLDLPGSIYEVPDKMWGIEAPGRDWHPGICVHSSSRAGEAMLIKGTSQSLLGDLSRYFLLEPTDHNGLKLPTAFNLSEIRVFPRSKIALLHFGRLLGRLQLEELIDLHEKLMVLGTTSQMV